jgi:hypothetical protein
LNTRRTHTSPTRAPRSPLFPRQSRTSPSALFPLSRLSWKALTAHRHTLQVWLSQNSLRKPRRRIVD